MSNTTMIYVGESLNLLMSLVGPAWAAGSDPKRRDGTAHRGWVLFWVGTTAYYAADLARRYLQAGPPFPGLPAHWWVPQIGLYFATAALLTTYTLTERYAERWTRTGIACSAVGFVAVAAFADILTTRCDHPARWHQGLTCVAVLIERPGATELSRLFAARASARPHMPSACRIGYIRRSRQRNMTAALPFTPRHSQSIHRLLERCFQNN